MHLAIDVTSKRIKAAIGDTTRGIASMASRAIAVSCSGDGFCRSCDEGTFFDDVAATIKAALARAGVSPTSIDAVTAASIRPSCVFTDDDLRPLYIGASFDLRGTDAAGEITERFEAATGKSFHEVTGHGPALMYPPARHAWFKEQEPEAWKRITQYLPVDGWILAMLGSEPHANECSAAESGFYDIETRTWSFEWEDILDLPAAFFPFIVAPGEITGEVSTGAAAATGLREGTPIVAGLPDTHAALIGAGCIQAGDACAVLGSTSPVQAVSRHRVRDPTARTWSTRLVVKGIVDAHVVEASAGITGQAIPWLARLLFPDTEIDQALHMVDACHDAFDASIVKDEAMNVLAHLGPTSLASAETGMQAGRFTFPTPCTVEETMLDRESLVAATFENVSFAVHENLAHVEGMLGRPVARTFVLGGMTRSRTLVQRLADLTGRDLVATTTGPEATIAGLLATCEVATGGIRTAEELEARVTATLRTIAPRPERTAIAKARFGRWRSLRDACKAG